MRSWLPVLLVVLLATSVGCGQAPPPAATAAPAAAPKATQPPVAPTAAAVPATTAAPPTQATAAPARRKPEGTLTLTSTQFSTEKWLTAQTNTAETMIMSSLYEFLVDYEPDTYKEIPQLAEKWEMSPDGLRWTFYLRKGVQFHDGYGEFTAEDVKFNWDLAIHKDSKNPLAAWGRSSVKSLEIVNPYQVAFNMTSPNYALLQRLGNQQPYLAMASKKYVEAVGQDKAASHPIGTGPYKFVEHKPGQSVTFEAVEDHWRQVPYYKTLVIKHVPEEATRVAMLKAGEADLIQISPQLVADVKKAGFGIMEMPNSYAEMLFFGGMSVPENPAYKAQPWNGPDPEKSLKVRKAMALAIDKQAIIDHVLYGMAKPMAVFQAAPGLETTDPDLKPYPYNPTEARKLLGEAGYPNGFDITLEIWVSTGRPSTSGTAEAAAAYWSDIGIRTKIVPTEIGIFLPKFQKRQNYNPFAWPGPIYGDPAPQYLNIATTKSQMNIFESHELDRLIQRAASNMDSRSRVQQWKDTAKYVHDNYLHIAIASVSNIYAVSKKIGKWPVPLGAPPIIHSEYITP